MVQIDKVEQNGRICTSSTAFPSTSSADSSISGGGPAGAILLFFEPKEPSDPAVLPDLESFGMAAQGHRVTCHNQVKPSKTKNKSTAFCFFHFFFILCEHDE